MKSIVTSIFIIFTFISCDKSEDDSCACENAKAGTEQEGFKKVFQVKLCDTQGLEIDDSEFVKVITNKSSEQLAAKSIKDGCDN